MKILIEESVLRQALEALLFLGSDDLIEIRALRTALEAAENVEPLDLCKIYREMKGIDAVGALQVAPCAISTPSMRRPAK